MTDTSSGRRAKRDPARATKTATRTRAGSGGDRRQAILGIATRYFATHGFEATTVRQIADDANILSGSLYHHFETKDDILDEIIRDVVRRMRDDSVTISGRTLIRSTGWRR